MFSSPFFSRRVKLSLSDVTIRVEYVPGIEPAGLAIEILFGRIFYHGDEQVVDESYKKADKSGKAKEILKKISFENVKISTDFFRFTPKQHSSMADSRRGPDLFGGDEASKKLSDDDDEDDDPGGGGAEDASKITPALQLASFNGRQALIMNITGKKNELEDGIFLAVRFCRSGLDSLEIISKEYENYFKKGVY